MHKKLAPLAMLYVIVEIAEATCKVAAVCVMMMLLFSLHFIQTHEGYELA